MSSEARPVKLISLAAKEYFNVEEAAFFCCVSTSQFRAKSREAGLVGGRLWGRVVYRRCDVLTMVEREIRWPPSIGEGM
jgi:hypothetical protein